MRPSSKMTTSTATLANKKLGTAEVLLLPCAFIIGVICVVSLLSFAVGAIENGDVATVVLLGWVLLFCGAIKSPYHVGMCKVHVL